MESVELMIGHRWMLAVVGAVPGVQRIGDLPSQGLTRERAAAAVIGSRSAEAGLSVVS